MEDDGFINPTSAKGANKNSADTSTPDVSSKRRKLDVKITYATTEQIAQAYEYADATNIRQLKQVMGFPQNQRLTSQFVRTWTAKQKILFSQENNNEERRRMDREMDLEASSTTPAASTATGGAGGAGRRSRSASATGIIDYSDALKGSLTGRD
jgi:hypothetical protein